jgi:murein tripeptide amidase MpaA
MQRWNIFFDFKIFLQTKFHVVFIKLLRDTFIFKIVPMLNPDGVVIGNYRCSLTGRDLNRNYKTVLKEAFPSVWHTREMIKKLTKEREVLLYCDLHGHSRKNNVFIYGCNNDSVSKKRFQEQVFPMMLSKNARDIVNLFFFKLTF